MHTLILRPGAIGDTLLTLPILRALRVQAPHSRLTFVGNRAVLPLLKASGLAEEVCDYEEARWSRLFMAGAAQSRRYASELETLLQSNERAICWLNDTSGMVKQNLVSAGIRQITIAPGRPLSSERLHIVSYLARTVDVPWRESDLDGSFSQLFKPVVDILPLEQQPIAIHPGSGGASKCWPIASFAAIIEALWQRALPVLLLAGPADYVRLDELRHLLTVPTDPSLFTVLVDAPLVAVAERLQRCRGYLGNDAGLTHLAALLGLRTVVLFGPSDPVIWRPVGPSVHIVLATELAELAVEVVLKKLAECLF